MNGLFFILAKYHVARNNCCLSCYIVITLHSCLCHPRHVTCCCCDVTRARLLFQLSALRVELENERSEATARQAALSEKKQTEIDNISKVRTLTDDALISVWLWSYTIIYTSRI